jgi:hypothetical protein
MNSCTYFTQLDFRYVLGQIGTCVTDIVFLLVVDEWLNIFPRLNFNVSFHSKWSLNFNNASFDSSVLFQYFQYFLFISH